MTDYNLPKNTNRHDSVPVLNPTEQKPCQPPTCDGNNDAPNDAQSSADRMQLVVETLTSDYYGDSILVDYAMAHRVIAYCRRVADGRLVGGWPMGAAKITGRAARFTK